MSQIIERIKNAVKFKSGESTSSKKVQSWTIRDSRPCRNRMTNNYATGTFTGLMNSKFGRGLTEPIFSGAGLEILSTSYAGRPGKLALKGNFLGAGRNIRVKISNRTLCSRKNRFSHPSKVAALSRIKASRKRNYYASVPAGLSVAGLVMVMGIVMCGGQNASALTVSISNPITINIPTKSESGDFVESSPATITVNSDSGYTLSMALADEDSDTNLTSGSNKIESISSSLSKTEFSKESNTTYNNKWGYKPSQYVTVDGDNKTVINNTGDDSVFKPLPGLSGEILDYKDSSSGENTYTLSIGARASTSTPLGEYASDTFIIAAVANVEYLQITYDANGGYFGSDTSKTTNLVSYDAVGEMGTTEETVTKYSHTSNINDSGVASGQYPSSQATTDKVTIPGATELNVTIYYSTESSYDYVYVFQGEYTGTPSKNMSAGQLKTYNGGAKKTFAEATKDTFTVSGDTVTFAFYSDSSTNYYGYYAVVTGEVETEIVMYSKTMASGAYVAPNNDSEEVIGFLGWSEDPNAKKATYADESEVSTNLRSVNGDAGVTLYAVWKPSVKYMQNWTGCSSMAVGDTVTLVDSRDDTEYTVGKLADEKCWMLDNLALNLLDSTVQANLNTETTNVTSNDTITHLLSGGGSTSDKYATSGLITWPASSYSYSVPWIKTGYETNTYASDPFSDEAKTWKYGTYYNYCAASAGSYCYGNGTSAGTSSGNATESICPKGWRMPGSGSTVNLTATPPTGEFRNLYNKYSGGTPSQYVAFRVAFRLPLSGYFYSGSAINQGGLGNFWSSTRDLNSGMYRLSLSTSTIYPANYSSRSYGNSLRCVAGS